MAASQNSRESSHNSQWTPRISSSISTPAMGDSPPKLSAGQIEAQEVLRHLLSRLKDPESKYYARYGEWVERHPRLDDFCLLCIRPQVWTYISGRWSFDALKSIGGNLRSDLRAIYLNGILGLDKHVRVYIGQASSLHQRIAQHLNFRHRRDNPSLHYHAMQSSVYNIIGVLAVLPSPSMGNHTLPGMDDPVLLLNVLEMWMCLVFRSLPNAILEEWVPKGIDPRRKEGREGVLGGLNITSPLDYRNAKPGFVDLTDSDDSLVREYLSVGMAKSEQRKGPMDDEVVKRKYAVKARRLNHPQRDIIMTGNTLIVFGVGVALGLSLMKIFGAVASGQ